MSRRYLSELLGTFALVFAGTGAMVINEVTQGQVTHVGIAVTFGGIVMALILALGEVSGAHFNPAVTVALWAARKCRLQDVGPYLLAQCLGAVLASLFLSRLFPESVRLGATLPAGTALQSFTLEVVLTAFLMLVILQVSGPSSVGPLAAAVAIGTVVGLEAMFAGPISGASMNPARSLGPAVVSGNLDQLWIYWAAPLLGALIAVVVARYLRPPSSPSPTKP